MAKTLNAETPAEWDLWLGVVSCLSGMPGMTPEHQRRLADKAVELMRASEAERHADVVVDSSEKGDA